MIEGILEEQIKKAVNIWVADLKTLAKELGITKEELIEKIMEEKVPE